MQDPNSHDTKSNPDRNLGGIIIGGLALIAIVAAILTWMAAGRSTASNTPAGTTIGQGSTPTPNSTTAPTVTPSR